MNPSENTPQDFQDDEIDLVDLLRPIYNNWRLLVKSAIAFGFIGMVYSLSLPNIFTAKITFIPQTGSESGGRSSLSGIASLTGINFGSFSSGSDIPSLLYPQIVSSVPYKRELLAQEITVAGESVTIGEYFSSREESNSILVTIIKYTVGLPRVILNVLRGSSEAVVAQEVDIYQVTKDDRELFMLLEGNLILSLNIKEGFVTLEFSDNDKFIAAQVAERSKELLQRRIIEFKSLSARELLTFTSRQYEENKAEYERLQDSLAIFKDQNLNISSSLYQNRLDRLVRELNIASSVTEQLASEVEQAKLQVNRDTPVFTVIEPVTVPYERDSPNRSLIVISLTFLGLFLSGIFIVLKNPATDLWESLKMKKE